MNKTHGSRLPERRRNNKSSRHGFGPGPPECKMQWANCNEQIANRRDVQNVIQFRLVQTTCCLSVFYEGESGKIFAKETVGTSPAK
jgi:hypothetical protein